MNYSEYWTQFGQNIGHSLGPPKAKRTSYRALCPGVSPRTWIYASLHLDDDLQIRKSVSVGVSFTGADARVRYQATAERCGDAIAQLQGQLTVNERAANGPFFEQRGAGKAYCFSVRNEAFNPQDMDTWAEQHAWINQWLPRYTGVFRRCLCHSSFR